MKPRIIKNLPLLFMLISGFGLVQTGRMTAQTFRVLHSFTGGTNGMGPVAELIVSSNTLYGTSDGLPGTILLGATGPYDGSTVFKVNMDGSGFRTLQTFTATSGSWPFTNSDGALRAPNGALLLSSNTLYGTAALGGLFGFGTAFRVNIDGSGFTNLHNFPQPAINSDTSVPSAGLALSGETLYGTTSEYGSGGSIFKINTDGTGFATLYHFQNAADGSAPQAGLILSGNTLYGTAEGGIGEANTSYGSVFKINTDGTGFVPVHTFTPTSSSYPNTNRDGASPVGRLLLSGSTLYGTSLGGGLWGWGTIFRVNTDGTGFTNLHNFTPPAGDLGTNSDGISSFAGLVLVGDTLYGTARIGGSSNQGTLFQLNTDGSGFKVLHHFIGGSDGANPGNGLVVVSNSLYGVAWGGGASGNGIVFSLSLPLPPLTIVASKANVVLSWPTNVTGVVLQSTTNLASDVWTTNSLAPVALNGLNIATNHISGTRQFFRLSQ